MTIRSSLEKFVKSSSHFNFHYPKSCRPTLEHWKCSNTFFGFISFIAGINLLLHIVNHCYKLITVNSLKCHILVSVRYSRYRKRLRIEAVDINQLYILSSYNFLCDNSVFIKIMLHRLCPCRIKRTVYWADRT